MGVTAMAIAAVTDSSYAMLAGRAGRLLSARRVKLMSRISGRFLSAADCGWRFPRTK